jgi:hypothetical protein
MAGIIVGFYGYQRSGKTLMAFLKAEEYRKQGCSVYSNMTVPNWTKIDSLMDIPFDFKPKVLVLDEAYYFLDSRNWHKNTNASIFFNTIGKQNILLIITAVNVETVELRLRQQHNYMYIVKADKSNIYYKMFDVVRNKSKVFTLRKCDDLFKMCTYDTQQIPDMIDTSLDKFADKVKAAKGLTNYNKNYLKEFDKNMERKLIKL